LQCCIAFSYSSFLKLPSSATLTPFWYGKLCYEKSEIAQQAEFTFDQEGFDKVSAWLEEQYKQKPIHI